MASGATTCYKKKTCSEGGYYDSVPADQKCSPKPYNGYSCYTDCTYKTCSDYGYEASIPSGKTCTTVYPRSGLTCYKSCKNDEYYDVTFKFLVGTSCTGTSTAADLHIYLRIRSQADDHLVYELSETVHCSHGDTSDAHLYARDMPAGTYDLEQFSISGGTGELHIDNVSGSVRAPLEGESFEVDSKFSNPGYYYVYSLTWL